MEYMPIFTRLDNKECLVVGGGDVALRKIELLMQAGANVRVVTKHAHPEINRHAENRDLVLSLTSYRPEFITDVDLVIAATSDRELNRKISEDASERNLFVNVVDDVQLSSFIVPSIVDRKPVTIAVSTGGASPVLARLLRNKLESLIPHAYGKLTTLASRYRDEVKSSLTGSSARKAFWEEVFEGVVAEKVFAGDIDAANSRLQQLLKEFVSGRVSQGEVYLVGAGPGDPELLTLRALRLIQKADVVIYDRLVSPEILSMVRRDASKVYVGKERNHHCVPQHEINTLLVKLAGEGKRVLRLKGGDPYIFGRGGEEAESLVQAGVTFQVVPGITSAAGASTYCGIPLTHRDYAQSVTFATGHLKDGRLALEWSALAQPQNTLVIYMGLGSLKEIAAKLVEHDRGEDTPVAVIHRATLTEQTVVIGNLGNIAKRVVAQGLTSPVIIIVGEVVCLYDRLNPNTEHARSELNRPKETSA